MESRFIPVASVGELDQLLARSRDATVVLFKHSNACPISAAAYQQMKGLDEDVAIVVVQKAREVSREVEARTGVRHETPQTLLLRGGRAVWSASHWDITSESVADALREQQQEGATGE
ncbi:MAG: bacillithiol system redox-active protein YtxJ [Pyrinomonadaceae bacterium]